MDNKQIGKNLESARTKVKLNKRQFAKIAGVDASQYGRVERGEEGFSRENLLLIAEKHGINIDFLSTGKGPILTTERENADMHDNAAPEISENIPILSQGQIISILAMALKDQAKAFADQAEIMKSIESKMARQDSQAKIDKTTERTEINLGDTKELIELLASHVDTKFQDLAEQLSKLSAHKNASSPDSNKKQDGSDGAGQKHGKRPS